MKALEACENSATKEKRPDKEYGSDWLVWILLHCTHQPVGTGNHKLQQGNK